MKTMLTPYLSFKGNCSEAMKFYQECLGGELSLQTVGDSPMAAQWPADAQNKILHASLNKESLILLGSDMGDTENLPPGSAISLALGCSSEEEIKFYFKNLSRGGKVTHELHRFFNGTIGAITDKYGMNWILKL